MLLVAVKGNREVKIDNSEKQAFIEDRYKIIEVDDKGKQVVVHDPNAVEVVETETTKKLKEVTAELETSQKTIDGLTKENENLEKTVEEIRAELIKVTDELNKIKKDKK